VIFVTLGTHEQPFERALDGLAELHLQDELVIQHGHTPRRDEPPATWIDFGSYDELLGLLRNARAVVCHAGVGTILSSLGVGKCPVVIPRLKRFGEHVDDHQLQITRAFAARGIVIPCLDPQRDLAACIARAGTSTARRPAPAGDLRDAVAAATRPQGPGRRASDLLQAAN
jgi:exopolysaccharide biosynthesis glucuronosyltransferase PssE